LQIGQFFQPQRFHHSIHKISFRLYASGVFVSFHSCGDIALLTSVMSLPVLNVGMAAVNTSSIRSAKTITVSTERSIILKAIATAALVKPNNDILHPF